MSRKNGRVINCANCGVEKYKPLAKLKRATNYFCSSKCHDEFRMDRVEVECQVCGKKMNRVKSQANKKSIFCSHECQGIGLKGINISGFFKKGNKREKCINFKNGTQTANGYIAVLMADHPFAHSKGYVYEHRLVMEKQIGRYLKPEEVVHHKDFDKQNNDIKNLILFATDKEHRRHHYLLKKGLIDADGNKISQFI